VYRTIASSIRYPEWAGTADSPSRWRHLDQMDRLLDGRFYNHLRYGFYEEHRPGTQDMIPLQERRPSSQYHLPRMVARWSSRKLWTGRHVPRVKHEDKSVTKAISRLTLASRFNAVMMDATIHGSVGSVAITYRVSEESGEEPQVSFKVWRAKFCTPSFDDFCNLTNLRVHYNVSGRALLEKKFTVAADMEPIKADREYWYVRDYGLQSEATYRPPRIEDWNPVTGWTREGIGFSLAVPEVRHNLDFVPGVWIRNLTGGCDFDGVGTWEDSISTSVEIDYLLSQASRGTRYNCAPELILVGKLMGGGDEVGTRSPADYIHLEAAVKQENGDSFGEGKASLLEMTGDGIKAAQDLIDKLRNMALEQIGATRKDPEKLKGVMSGRAMEFLDEDSHDLVMELRSSYGDGALELLRKVVRSIEAGGDPRGLTLDWPRLYQPTPEDLAHLIPALVLAATPIQEPLDPETAAKISDGPGGADSGETVKSGGGGGDGGKQTHQAETKTHKTASGSSHTVKKETTEGPAAQGGRPAATPTGGKILGSLLEIEEASAFLKMNMDIDLLPEEDEEGVSDSDVPTRTDRPPASDDLGPEEGTSGLNMDIPTP
jgi:hypothetical protein